MLLAKQKESCHVFLVEDAHWLELSDDEEEEANAHFCLMAKENYANSDNKSTHSASHAC